MKLMGHRTLSIFERYAIVDEAMLQEQAAKLAALAPTRAERKVVGMPVRHSKGTVRR